MCVVLRLLLVLVILTSVNSFQIRPNRLLKVYKNKVHFKFKVDLKILILYLQNFALNANILETATGSGNFNTLVAALKATGLADTLTKGGIHRTLLCIYNSVTLIIRFKT